MAGNAVQPLRINKMSSSSPTKLPRPLAEISTTERRRNSPSYNQTTKKMIGANDGASQDGSPVRSPRSIWAKDSMARGRFVPENSLERENVVPSKRSSIENLKKQSRVANSPMFARETRDKYDPSSSPIIERPLTDRPLSDRIQQNPFTKFDTNRKDNSPVRSPERPGHRRTESRTEIPITAQPQSPPQSPQKSSLTSKSRYGSNALALDMDGLSIVEDGSRAPTPRQSLRPAKSVTFETAPPETHEYEQQTPEPSSIASGSREGSYESDDFEDNSFERGSSAENEEDSFDASLEDTAKTPVVLPGDWRNASPDTARTDLIDDMDDVFEGGSPPPTATPGRLQQPLISTRSESMNSEGSNRPLPPIPGLASPGRGRRSSASLTAAAERASSSQRGLPSPPRPASVSKDEILRMREVGMSREDRMSLMALQESLAEENRRSSIIIKSSPVLLQSQPDADQVGELPEFDAAPQISRESILKKVKADLNQEYIPGDEAIERESFYSDNEIDYSDLAKVDPDTPIPSRENSTQFQQLDMPIKEEHEESVLDLDHIPQLSYDPAALGEFDSPFVGSQRQSSVVHFGVHEAEAVIPGAGLGILDNEKFSTPAEEPTKPSQPALSKKTSLPFLANFLGKSEYDFGLTDYMALDGGHPIREEKKPEKTRASIGPIAAELRTSLSSAGEDTASDRGTSEEGSVSDFEPAPVMEAPVIPERKATIKTGGKLKARPSGTSADLEAVIAAAQREAMAAEQMPDLPVQYRPGSQARSEDSASVWSEPSTVESNESKNDSAVGHTQEFKLDVGLSSSDNDLGTSFSLAQEMERVMDAQKKGYLMRQNTKVIVASRRDFSDNSAATAASSDTDVSKPSAAKGAPVTNGTRKPSAGEKFIQTEPWNGKMRRKSGRKSSGRRSNIGVAPPLPGQDSALGTLDEHSILSDTDPEVERGRLFVKVASVKDLDMPLPRNDRLFFQLTLDNGLHCVTTGNLDLGKNVPIGQEFELVVQQDLDFQLTLTTNLPPPPKISQPVSFTSSHRPKSPSKSVFSRLLSSPKKRAEQERRAQAEAEAEDRRRAEEAERQRLASRPTAWDKMRELVDGTTGSFARSYISLKTFEEQSYGRMLTTHVPLYNEWAMENDMNVVSSVRSKRSNGFGMGMRADGVVRRPPYQIGSLELNLLYIPRSKGLEDSDMPKSMSAALREMKEAEQVSSVHHEGYLSQQGGDCPFWRRRFFKLSSTKLTAFHEHTMQPRATINLAKAAKLIDDKTSLVADPAANGASKSGAKKRRKSAFAEEDEGYQFVEEGFRLRFTNGETIDFYADSTAEKDRWMTALSQAIGKTTSTGKAAKWTEHILAHEARLASRKSRNPTVAAPEINVCPPTSSQGSLGSWTRSAPTSPVKSSASASVVRKEVPRPVSMAPRVPPKDQGSEDDLHRHVPPEARWLADSVSSKTSSRGPGSPPMGRRSEGKTRKAVKSMIL